MRFEVTESAGRGLQKFNRALGKPEFSGKLEESMAFLEGEQACLHLDYMVV